MILKEHIMKGKTICKVSDKA